MKKYIYILATVLFLFSSCCDRKDRSRVLYENGKCVVIQLNDSTLILAPGINSDSRLEVKTVIINRKNTD